MSVVHNLLGADDSRDNYCGEAVETGLCQDTDPYFGFSPYYLCLSTMTQKRLLTEIKFKCSAMLRCKFNKFIIVRETEMAK
jgi:hypothetical protein